MQSSTDLAGPIGPASPDRLVRTDPADAAETLGRALWLRLASQQLEGVRSTLRIADLEPTLAEYLGTPHRNFRKSGEAAVVALCRARLEAMESAEQAAHACLRERLATLAGMLALSATGAEVLLFAAVCGRHAALRALCRCLRARSEAEAAEVVARLLALDPAPVRELLAARGALCSHGLLSHPDDPEDVEDFVDASEHLPAALVAAGPVEEFLLSRSLEVAPAPLRGALDYAHLAAEIQLVRAVLQRADGAAHVLLAGAPGVGKTQLARWIAAQMQWQAWEVRAECGAGVAGGRQARFGHYALASRLLGGCADRLVIFDEAEDVFTGDHWVHVGASDQRHKAWTNRLLEGSRVPTVWISNSLRHIDPAYLRRFDYVLRLGTPPRSVRRRLLAEAVAGHDVPAPLLDRIAESRAFTPGDADRIARVLPRALAQGLDAASALRELATCRPGGPARSALAAPRGATLPYRPEWINAGTDVVAVIGGLARRGNGVLGFFGPPGTGKTELARHIARALDRPLLLQKASDLLSPWLGVTEQKIAAAFDEALREDAVLLIDEADSFLRDRAGARASWEVSQVNELLAQLDGYTGYAILASNFADALDRALLRRIDVKLTFRALAPAHAWECFVAALGVLGCADVPGPESAEAQALRGVHELAFGDFAAAVRGLQLRGGAGAQDLLAALAEEVRHKQRGGGRIGF